MGAVSVSMYVDSNSPLRLFRTNCWFVGQAEIHTFGFRDLLRKFKLSGGLQTARLSGRPLHFKSWSVLLINSRCWMRIRTKINPTKLGWFIGGCA